MADKTLDDLNLTQIELLQKYNDTLNKFSIINDLIVDDRIAEAENALKLNGLNLYATVNEDGSFNDDGIFKITEVNGQKTLFGILDVNMYVMPKTVSFDIFGDGSCLALFELNGNVKDTGGIYNGVGNEIDYCEGKIGLAVKSIANDSQITINNLPFDENTDVVTISAWIKWNGFNTTSMPFGWSAYDIYISHTGIGFNTGNGDMYGIPSSGFANTWKHIVAEFRKGEYGKIWIDGELQNLSSLNDRDIYVDNAVMGSTFYIFGWGDDTNYGNFGCVDHLRIFNRALTDDEVKILYNEGA